MAHLFFSIVVVSLNPGEKLVPTLKSVLDQDYGNFEIIIKDGGSTDGSVEKLEELRLMPLYELFGGTFQYLRDEPHQRSGRLPVRLFRCSDGLSAK